MIYVVGGTGFVGSAYVRLFARLGLPHRVIGRTDWDAVRGTRCDVLVNAGGNSKKFLAAREPLVDFDLSVRSVLETIDAVDCGTYVMLSSGDVYPDQATPALTHEDQTIDPALVSRYGQHKLLAEQLVRGGGRDWLILRMGGFVGPGLKKNAIFDMLADAPVWLAPESELQFVSTDRAAEIVWDLVEQGIRRQVINLGATGLVHLGTLHRELGSRSPFQPQAPVVRYDLDLDKLKRFYRGTLPDSGEEVYRFVSAWKATKPAA
jgi:nucleoside-diphosphate-sugar epimerase